MDFSPRNTDISSELDCLKLAVASASQLCLRTFLYPGNCDLDNSSPRTPVDDTSLYPSGLHSHPFPEICLMLQGDAIVAIDDSTSQFTPTMAVLCKSGMPHAEGWHRKHSEYALMWLSYSGKGMLAMISRYHPESGWDCPHRWPLRGRHVQRLFAKATNAPSPLTDAWFERFSADLVSVLADLLQKTTYAQTSSSTGATNRPEKHAPILRELRAFLDNHFSQSLSVEQLAATMRMSPNYLNQLFAKYTGEPIHSYLIRLRMQRAMLLCQTTDMLIKQIALSVGYEDPLYFSRAFRRYHGRWPSDVRKIDA